ncbi:RICIN domain-containing protein [Roseofilum halophilum]|uniref:RICIN domain-containing protein n=1 Tax=Roseofilum halophilum TaxID=3082942 RepID=UPI003D2F8226
MKLNSLLKTILVTVSLVGISSSATGVPTCKNNFVYVRTQHSDKCIHIPPSFNHGTPVTQWNCVNQYNLHWERVNSSQNGKFFIKSRSTGLCIQVDGSSNGDNVTISQYPCQNRPNFLWSTRDAGNGFVYLVNMASGKCLQVNGHSQEDNARISQWNCLNQPHFKWRFTQAP